MTNRAQKNNRFLDHPISKTAEGAAGFGLDGGIEARVDDPSVTSEWAEKVRSFRDVGQTGLCGLQVVGDVQADGDAVVTGVEVDARLFA